MFNQLSIYKKLYLVLGFLIGVFFFGTEWSLYQSSEIKKRIHNIYTQELIPLENLSHLKGSLYRIRDRTLRLADAKRIEELQKHKSVIKKQLRRIENKINQYSNTRLSIYEQEKLSIFQKNLKEYIEILKNKIYPLSENLSSENKINALLYKEAIKHFRNARDALNDLSEYQMKRAKKRLENSNTIFNHQWIVVQLLIFVVLLLSVFFSKKLIDSILLPIEKISQTLKHITEFDFSKKLTLEGKNEFTKIAFMLNENIETLKNTFIKLDKLAHIDSLTSIPNRRAFTEKLEELSNKSTKEFSIMFLDIDNFKNINDTYGHDVGDEFLTLFTKRVKEVLRKKDFLARLGGDEFAIILNTTNDVHLGNIANKILHTVSSPYFCCKYTIFSSVSIGIVNSSYHSNISVKELMSYADIAMYQTKNSGKASYTFFDTQMNHKLQETMTLESGLRDALKHKEFQLYYQPIIEPKLETLYGIETLLRWEKDGKLISPARFLSKLESMGLIREVTYFIIDETFSMIEEEKLQCVVSINFSVLQFYDDNIIHFLKRMLQKYKTLETSNIYFEITESVFAQNSEYIQHAMTLITELGFHFSLDDFGTGYSSLAYLKDYPISTLKIDKSFIDNIDNDIKSMELLSSIVYLANALKLTVIIEGVESKKTLDLVTKYNGVKIQGYYYYKPLSKEEFLSIMK